MTLKVGDWVWVDYEDGKKLKAEIKKRGKGSHSHRVKVYWKETQQEVWINENNPLLHKYHPEEEEDDDEDQKLGDLNYGPCTWLGCAYINSIKTKFKCQVCSKAFHGFHNPGAKHCAEHTVSTRKTGQRRKAIQADELKADKKQKKLVKQLNKQDSLLHKQAADVTRKGDAVRKLVARLMLDGQAEIDKLLAERTCEL